MKTPRDVFRICHVYFLLRKDLKKFTRQLSSLNQCVFFFEKAYFCRTLEPRLLDTSYQGTDYLQPSLESSGSEEFCF